MSPPGEIQIILGPMFSGKTSELMRRVRRSGIAGRKCLIIKYSKDTRYEADGKASTHDRLTCPAVPCVKLADVEEQADAFDVIGIDEAQFFPDLLHYADKWAQAGKLVIVAALDGTYKREPFGSTLQLIPLANDVIKLRAVCSSCGEDAPFTQRRGEETELEIIGGQDKYVATCRKCVFMPF